MSAAVRGRVPQSVRDAAVEAVEKMTRHTRSPSEAIRLVARQLDVHPNTIRNWIAAAEPERPAHAPGVDPDVVAKATAEQFTILQQLNSDLTAALRARVGQ